MSVQLDINGKCFSISTARMIKVLSGDAEKATYMGLWDRIKDLFRSDKKHDALNELCNLIYTNHSEDDSKFSKSVVSFLKLKEMALPAEQDLFQISEVEDRISFAIGTTVICEQVADELSADDQAFNAIYATAKLNDRVEIAKELVDTLMARRSEEISKCREGQQNPARENHQDTPVIDIKDQLQQLFKDISRGKYQFPGVNDQIESTGSTNRQACLLDFLDKLTPEQQRSLNIVGTQIAPITLKNVVYQASAEHAFIGNPTAKYQFDICPEQKVLLAYVSLEQNHDANYFDMLKSGYGSGYETARYPNLGAQAIFSITEAGDIQCDRFHVTSYADWLAASALTSDHPCQYKLLNGLKGFIEEADVRFFIATQGDSEIQLDQAARMNWRSNALREQLERYSVEEKQQILENLEGEFGTRLHSVLDFAAAQTSIRSEDALLISMTSKYAKVLDEMVIVLREQLNIADKQLTPAPIIHQASALTASELLALSLLNINLSMLD